MCEIESAGDPITDMEVWIEQTLLEAVAEERDPTVLLGFLATVGEIAAQRNGYEFLAEEIKEDTIVARIKPDKFVQLWLEACENRESISWIGNTIGISDARVLSLASTLRRAGVQLPPIRRPFVEPVDVDTLNKQIRAKWGDDATS